MIRAALADAPSRRFFAAHAQSCLGSGLAYVALPLLAYDRFGSAWAVVAVLLPDLLPAVVLGPLIGASLMARFGIDGVFYFMAAAVLLLALVAGVGSLMRQPPTHLVAPFEILTPQAGPLAHDPLDPMEGRPQLNDPG